MSPDRSPNSPFMGAEADRASATAEGKKKPKMKSGNGLNKSMVPLEPGWVRAALRFFVVRFYPAIARPIYRRGTPMLVALRKVVDCRSRVSFPGGVLGPNVSVL
nr:hypothetical protein Iba_chr10bCG4670 [Ipomoea batatas]